MEWAKDRNGLRKSDLSDVVKTYNEKEKKVFQKYTLVRFRFCAHPASRVSISRFSIKNKNYWAYLVSFPWPKATIFVPLSLGIFNFMRKSPTHDFLNHVNISKICKNLDDDYLAMQCNIGNHHLNKMKKEICHCASSCFLVYNYLQWISHICFVGQNIELRSDENCMSVHPTSKDHPQFKKLKTTHIENTWYV